MEWNFSVHDTWNLEYSTGIRIELAGTNHTSLHRNSTTLSVDTTEGGSSSGKRENIIYVVHTYIQMENSIPIPQGKPGMEWN